MRLHSLQAAGYVTGAALALLIAGLAQGVAVAAAIAVVAAALAAALAIYFRRGGGNFDRCWTAKSAFRAFVFPAVCVVIGLLPWYPLMLVVSRKLSLFGFAAAFSIGFCTVMGAGMAVRELEIIRRRIA